MVSTQIDTHDPNANAEPVDIKSLEATVLPSQLPPKLDTQEPVTKDESETEDDQYSVLRNAGDLWTKNDTVVEKVKVPEWGFTVYVRNMRGFERDAYEQSLIIGKGKNRDVNLRNARAKLVALTVCDPDNPDKRIFSDSDVSKLTLRNAGGLDRIATVAQRLSGLTDRDLDDLTKNSDGGLNADSPSN